MRLQTNVTTRAILTSAVVFSMLGLTCLPATAAPDEAQNDVFRTTQAYVSQFYPLWFTFNQTRFGNKNQFAAPNRITPLYHFVVAINNDTMYATNVLDLSAQPVILTLPETSANYSVLVLDPYCNIFATDIKPPTQPPTQAKFILYGPSFKGALPAGVTPVPMALDYMTLIIRIDRYTGKVDMTSEAAAFRQLLHTEPLCSYLGQTCPRGVPLGGDTRIVPEALFAVPFKTFADTEIAVDPIPFLRQLQTAVRSRRTPPMSDSVKALSDRFDTLFADRSNSRSDFAAGARAAHFAIVNNYLSHLGKTNWITYNDIGHWGNRVVRRSSITEFIQYANDRQAAAYYHAFRDRTGAALDGTNPKGYVLTFSKRKIPDAKRFWSVTAYTPEAIELVPNSADKYLVASYTPGLTPNPDGSYSIYMARKQPSGVPPANWLPIPPGPFNVMLRVYGPEGDVAKKTYVPPGIVKVQ